MKSETKDTIQFFVNIGTFIVLVAGHSFNFRTHMFTWRKHKREEKDRLKLDFYEEFKDYRRAGIPHDKALKYRKLGLSSVEIKDIAAKIYKEQGDGLATVVAKSNILRLQIEESVGWKAKATTLKRALGEKLIGKRD